MSEQILLTEANYKDKYPPLGLMKIATYHKMRGDNVIYTREFVKEDRNYFSKIYISTRFSFHWKKTKELVCYYKKNYNAEILIGGIHASLNPELYISELDIIPNVGSYKGDINQIIDFISNNEILKDLRPFVLKYGIDILPPDYSIFDNIDLPFTPILKDNYLIRATKGCKRNCSFCDVKKICEGYIDKLPIIPIVNYIDRHFGVKQNILFFDDNTFMSKQLDDIFADLKSIGFAKDSKLGRKLRTCDFNQGLDLRLLDSRKIDLLQSINIKTIRFAFDNIDIKEIFIDNIKKIIQLGICNISVYVLYNFMDTPEDFYERLSISAKLNEQFKCRIFSFPMKYVPNERTDRTYIGKHWTKRMIRGIQCILNSSHGIVPVKYSFFKRAFGSDYNEFLQIISMPEKYIIYREKYEKEIIEWKHRFSNVNRDEFIMAQQMFYEAKEINNNTVTNNENIINLMKHYKNEKC